MHCVLDSPIEHNREKLSIFMFCQDYEFIFLSLYTMDYVCWLFLMGPCIHKVEHKNKNTCIIDRLGLFGCRIDKFYDFFFCAALNVGWRFICFFYWVYITGPSHSSTWIKRVNLCLSFLMNNNAIYFIGFMALL